MKGLGGFNDSLVGLPGPPCRRIGWIPNGVEIVL